MCALFSSTSFVHSAPFLFSLVIVVFFFFSFVVDVLVFILILCTRFFSTYFSFRYLLHCLPFGWRSIAQRFVFFSDASMNFFHCCCVCVCKKITYASFAFFAQCFVCVCVFHGIWCASLFSLVFLIICNFFAALNSFLLGIFVAIASITFPVRFFSLSLFFTISNHCTDIHYSISWSRFSSNGILLCSSKRYFAKFICIQRVWKWYALCTAHFLSFSQMSSRQFLSFHFLYYV